MKCNYFYVLKILYVFLIRRNNYMKITAGTNCDQRDVQEVLCFEHGVRRLASSGIPHDLH